MWRAVCLNTLQSGERRIITRTVVDVEYLLFMFDFRVILSCTAQLCTDSVIAGSRYTAAGKIAEIHLSLQTEKKVASERSHRHVGEFWCTGQSLEVFVCLFVLYRNRFNSLMHIAEYIPVYDTPPPLYYPLYSVVPLYRCPVHVPCIHSLCTFPIGDNRMSEGDSGDGNWKSQLVSSVKNWWFQV